MYDLIADHLLQELLLTRHREEVKRTQAAKEAGEKITYTGVVTKEMKETAKLKGNVGNEIPVESVYRYLRDLSYEYCKKNPPTHVNKSIDKNKLDLGSLCHYLEKNALPGFEEPFEEPVIHLMFQEWENLRESGITQNQFTTFIKNSMKSSDDQGSVDILNGKNVFAFLLEEENIRYRGLVFDKFDSKPLDVPATSPTVLASLEFKIDPDKNGVSAPKLRSVRSNRIMGNHDTKETSNESDMDEKEEFHDIGNQIVGSADIVEQKEELDAPQNDVKDDATVETNANTSENEVVGNGDNPDENVDAEKEKEKEMVKPQQEAGLFNLFGMW